eukprot:1806238-Lingulodinium_polyedra.AAC.1
MPTIAKTLPPAVHCSEGFDTLWSVCILGHRTYIAFFYFWTAWPALGHRSIRKLCLDILLL